MCRLVPVDSHLPERSFAFVAAESVNGKAVGDGVPLVDADRPSLLRQEPVPIAVTIAWISSFERTLLIRFFSALMTFPRSGRMAW